MRALFCEEAPGGGGSDSDSDSEQEECEKRLPENATFRCVPQEEVWRFLSLLF